MRQLIAQAQDLGYDVIVFDSPQLGNVSDALSIATEVRRRLPRRLAQATAKAALAALARRLRRSRHLAARLRGHGGEEPARAGARPTVSRQASSSVGREALLILVAKALSALAAIVLAVVLANALGPHGIRCATGSP